MRKPSKKSSCEIFWCFRTLVITWKIQNNRSAVISTVPHAMITWSISSPTGEMRIPFKRASSLLIFSCVERTEGSPITCEKLYGYFTLKPIFSQKLANTDVTGTPVRSQVRYHNPAVANVGRIQVKKPLLSCFPAFPKISRHTSPTLPKAVENTRAVGL